MVKSGREKIRKAQKETPCVSYDTPPKDKAKLFIDAALNTTPTTEVHRAVAAITKKRKIDGDSASTANNVCLK